MTLHQAIERGIQFPPRHYFLGDETDAVSVAAQLRHAWDATPFALSAQGLTTTQGANGSAILFHCTPYRHGIRVQFRYSMSV